MEANPSLAGFVQVIRGRFPVGARVVAARGAASPTTVGPSAITMGLSVRA